MYKLISWLKKIPAKPGIYTLIIDKLIPEEIQVGKLGLFFFPKGFYSYTGSALGTIQFNLQDRIKYHLNAKKRLRWHIDYLLSSKKAKIRQIILAETKSYEECSISKNIEKLEMVKICSKGFGSSDCKNLCQAHLHFFKEQDYKRVTQEITKIYLKNGLKPILIQE